MDIQRFLKDLVHLGLESMGRYYSSYIAFVADVDDPENLHRLRLVIPDVGGPNVYDYWALPKGLFSGQGYGVQLLPQKGDTVWAEFRHGSPKKPILTWGYRAKNELPDEPDVTDKNCIWFITPKGIKIKINDTKNYIHIKTQDGKYIEINGDAISLVSDKQPSISLGKLNQSSYKAVLGEKNKDVLKDMQKFLTDFSTALQTDINASQGQQFLTKAALTAAAPGLSQAAAALGQKIDDTLSKIVTLE